MKRYIWRTAHEVYQVNVFYKFFVEAITELLKQLVYSIYSYSEKYVLLHKLNKKLLKISNRIASWFYVLINNTCRNGDNRFQYNVMFMRKVRNDRVCWKLKIRLVISQTRRHHANRIQSQLLAQSPSIVVNLEVLASWSGGISRPIIIVGRFRRRDALLEVSINSGPGAQARTHHSCPGYRAVRSRPRRRAHRDVYLS